MAQHRPDHRPHHTRDARRAASLPLRWAALALGVTVLVSGATVISATPSAAAVTMWGHGTPLGATAVDSGEAVTVGTRFTPSTSGAVVGVRFWKQADDDAEHDGALWSQDGTLLALASFDDESATGWQTADLDRPVEVTSGTTYVVAYTSPDGRYSTTSDFQGRSVSPELQVDADAAAVSVRGHGVRFPSWSERHRQYWVDVVFCPGASGGHTSIPSWSATAGPTWTPRPRPTASATAAPVPTATSTPAPVASATSSATPRPTATAPRPTTTSSAPPVVVPAPTTPKPGSSNTGVPDGVQLTRSGGMTVTTANTVLDGLDISGTVVIDAPGVTIRNSRILGEGFYGVQVVSGSVTITDSEIAGFENAIAGGSWTARRVDIHSVTGDGVKVGSDVTLDASWIHDLDPAPGAHADGVQMQSGVTDLVITGNSIDVGSDANSAIFLAPDLGPSSAGPVTVDGNWLDGGGYALFCVDGASGRYHVGNISITNNRFGTESRYGPLRLNVPATLSGNLTAAGALIQG
ncbi:MAG: DUF4082 domain-containing protein [Actinobacteria bacterium]|nr:DUF4082 domain-containing protein [Actinomycetota bacterium]MCG2802399.1 DUF4082 domain-containing protein [Cellulomonas sp.]